MSPNTGEKDEDVPQGEVTERKDGKVGKMREWRSSRGCGQRGREGWGEGRRW